MKIKCSLFIPLFLSVFGIVATSVIYFLEKDIISMVALIVSSIGAIVSLICLFLDARARHKKLMIEKSNKIE